MKKDNGQTSQPAAKNRKQYSGRLEAEGVPVAPTEAAVEPPRQFQLAHLAATLAKVGGQDVSAGELVARAMQIWGAAGRALFAEGQARDVVKGLFYLNRDDWDAHAEALILSHNDIGSAVPGQISSEGVRTSREAARARAGLAVSQVWGYGPGNEAALRALFSGTHETEATRGTSLAKLLRFAKREFEGCEVLALRADDSDLLKGCLQHAWEPLGMWDDGVFQKSIEQARAFVAAPDSVFRDPQLVICPVVARWLGLMRQHELAAAKTRS